MVLRGPLRGVEYPDQGIEDVDALVAKLVGLYEWPLHPVLEEQIHRGPPLFVDIGAAEGLYAAGIALASPTTQVHAFEQDRQTRRLLRQMLELNGVDERVRLLGECTGSELGELPTLDDAFILSDCEGAEHEIFSTEAIALMPRTTVLIELHSHHPAHDGVAELLSRFEATHRVSRIPLSQPDPDDFDELRDLSPAQRELAMTEFRTDPHGWALFEPRIA